MPCKLSVMEMVLNAQRSSVVVVGHGDEERGRWK
jgi:hypothetical protein